jgi:NADH:ubiquinone oxidoreductase subunit 4 (subunit M)
MVPLILLMVFMGVYPRPFLNRSDASIKQIQERVIGRAGGTIAEFQEPAER